MACHHARERMRRPRADTTSIDCQSKLPGNAPDVGQPEVRRARRAAEATPCPARATLDDAAVGGTSPNEMRHYRSIMFGGIGAARLTKARLAAGYRSGKAAAEAHGWPIGTYTSDESGRRGITPERADRYAEAFSVPGAWLLGEDPADGNPEHVRRASVLDSLNEAEVPRVFESPAIPVTASRGAGARLARARVDGGFVSVRAAARHLGLPASTCYGHENGRNNISERVARMYGLAYGADIAWLMTGLPPTGIDGEARLTGRAKGDPAEIAGLVAELRVPVVWGHSSTIPELPRLSRDALQILVGPLAVEAIGPFLVASVSPEERGGGAVTRSRIIIDAGSRLGDGLLAGSTPDGGIQLLRGLDDSSSPSNLIGRVLAIVKLAD